jgi:AcrR family transcriptional regulator
MRRLRLRAMASRDAPPSDEHRRALNPERRERVLEAAADALLERGFADTRISDIAERAGMSPGHVMYYFESKERILLDALRQREERLFYAQVEARGDVAPWPRLERWIDRSIPTGRGDEQWSLWLELWVRAVHDPRIADMLEERDARWTSTFRDVVDDGVRAGAFRAVDTDRFIDRLTALITGWAVTITAGAPGADRERAVGDCTALAIDALSPDGAPVT